MSNVKTKKDVILEVWRKSGSQVVGAKEIIKIEEELRKRFGEGAVDMPMRIARVLADAGANLNYPEIMNLDFRRRSESKYEPMFRNILKFETFGQALSSIRRIEALRKNFLAQGDKKGLSLIKETILRGIERANMIAKNEKVNPKKRAEKAEIAQWFRIYLQAPKVFENWIELRLSSEDFKKKFPEG
ncbi:MAG: hypothetical protein RML33_10750 [Acidobacteriota bacterium]|nr:hypothetical protein [Acidobacteriota bacterium]